MIIQQRTDGGASSEHLYCNAQGEEDEIPENEYKPIYTPLRLAVLTHEYDAHYLTSLPSCWLIKAHSQWSLLVDLIRRHRHLYSLHFAIIARSFGIENEPGKMS